MNKILKKAMAVALSAAMCVGLVGTALAADNVATGTASDTGTIIVSGLESGLTVKAYQIVEPVYGGTGNTFTKYQAVEAVRDVSGFTVNADGSIDWNEDEATLATLYNTISNVVTNPYSATSTDTGVATFTVPVGSYLIAVDGKTNTEDAVVYSMIIASVSYANENPSYGTNNGSVTVTGENAWVKAITPTVDKELKGGSANDWAKGDTADLGDTIDFEVKIADIPSYYGQNPEFKLTDTLSGGLAMTTAEQSNIIVTVHNADGHLEATLVKDKDFTITTTAQGFVIDFVVDENYMLNNYAGSEHYGWYILVDYEADVTDSAVLVGDESGVNGNVNDAVLTYSTTSYLANHEGKTEDETHTYTFDVQFEKADANNQTKTLEGAEFTLYTDENCSTAYTRNGSAYTATSTDSGIVEFTELEQNTYYVKETKAPAGYTIQDTIYKIVIDATYNADGTLNTHSVTLYTGEQGANAEYTWTENHAIVLNTPLSQLPSMGSTGIALCVIAGCVVLAGAVAGVAIYRRKNNAEV